MAGPSQTLKRIVAVEEALARLAEQNLRTSQSVEQLSTEMRAFKDEMRAFKDEMRAFKDDVRADRQADREAAAREREEAARERRELNRKLGEIANAQGRMVEDIVAPSLPRVLRQLLSLPEDAPIAPSGPRIRLKHPKDPSRIRELDVVAGHDEIVLVCEVKSVLGPDVVSAFAASLPEARELLEPLGAREVIGAVASLYVDPSVVAHATRLGLVVLAVGEEMLEVQNPPGFSPRRFA